jgi:hypothetical protein
MKPDVAPWDVNPSTVLQPDGVSMLAGSFGVRMSAPIESGGLMELYDDARGFMRPILPVSRIHGDTSLVSRTPADVIKDIGGGQRCAIKTSTAAAHGRASAW